MSHIPKDQRRLTGALHGYPKKHGLTIEWIANELWNRFNIKLAHSTLERYLNPNDDPKLPADLIGPICRICNNDFSALEFITISPEKKDVSIRLVASLIKKIGEASTEMSKSLEDGNIDNDERPRCITELLEAKDVINDLLARLIV